MFAGSFGSHPNSFSFTSCKRVPYNAFGSLQTTIASTKCLVFNSFQSHCIEQSHSIMLLSNRKRFNFLLTSNVADFNERILLLFRYLKKYMELLFILKWFFFSSSVLINYQCNCVNYKMVRVIRILK